MWHYWLQKTKLLKCLKGPVGRKQETCCQVPNTAETFTKALSYFSFTSLRWIELRNDSLLLVRSKILAVSVNILTADDKYSRENFTEQSQMQLSKKQKVSFGLKSAWRLFYPFNWSIRDELGRNLFLLLTFSMLGLFVNTLTFDDRFFHYSIE